MKIITIIGARPQFIKSSVLSNILENQHSNINEIIIHTGQHFDSNMSDIFFNQLSLKEPKYNLNIGGGTHGQMTGRQIELIENILVDEMPSLVIVYGDTNSTLSGTISAGKLNIPIVHIEAGLRSFNKKMPEEQNRIIADHLSSYLFTPSETSFKNLLNENIAKDKIFNYGDIMFDAVLKYKSHSKQPKLNSKIPNDFVLCTIHREENTDNDNNLINIINALNESNLNIIFPIHPRTKKNISRLNLQLSNKIICTEPIGYLEMTWLLSNCQFVITDSGGLQKEAFFHGKFCLIVRNETEWTELIDLNYAVLVGSKKERILAQVEMKNISIDFNKSPYGNGTTGIQIAKKLTEIL